ncbi:acyl-CoA-binding protein-like isoform X2 [Eleutherodactylus coqui]|uniref:acyl-CoA-binding protein-like isoform X2 n=1 Tax=Eleutherodactylus coqui TaxID=57060 RepID=UPI003462A641
MAAFDKAAKMVRQKHCTPTELEQLKIYSWYKQANVGDVDTDPPDGDARQKWEAWNKLKGTPQSDAMIQYIKMVKELKSKYGTQ